MDLDHRSSNEIQTEPAPAFTLRTAQEASFAMLDGEATLFCESAQKLYALNPAAALIWCCLEDGGSPQAARARLVQAGVDRTAAAEHVEQAIHSWLELGLLTADFDPAQDRHACTIRLCGQSFSVETSSRDLSRQIAALFDPHAPCSGDAAATAIKVIEIDWSQHVYFNERKVANCKPDELLPTIKALVTEQIVSRIRPEIVFHAACMSRGGRTLLVSGEPGAGKTTLALHLAAKGFGYGGDDVTLISPDGSAKGVPFAPAVKSGAWEVVSRIWPDLPNLPVHSRSDGKRVRYPQLGFVDEGSKPVGWIVFLRRASGVSVELARVGAVEAMHRVIEGAYSPDERLSLAGFGALRRMLAGAQTLELTYESSAEAADAITAFCDASA